jgi:hypothetical protein
MMVEANFDVNVVDLLYRSAENYEPSKRFPAGIANSFGLNLRQAVLL